MDFQQFFEIAGMGAMGLVVAILAWTVRETVNLTVAVRQLRDTSEATAVALDRDNRACQMERRENAVAMGEVKTDIALLKQRQEQHGSLLAEIHEHVLAAAPARARRKAAP